jgi:hypothetical protein
VNFRFSAEDATTQGAFVPKNLAKIAAVDPAAAGRATDEMLGLVLGRIADAPPEIFATRKVDH